MIRFISYFEGIFIIKILDRSDQVRLEREKSLGN